MDRLLGPSLLNKSSAAGANLQRINYTIQPPQKPDRPPLRRHVEDDRPRLECPAGFLREAEQRRLQQRHSYGSVQQHHYLNDGSHLASWAPAIAATETTAAVATHPYYTNPLTPPAAMWTDGTLHVQQLHGCTVQNAQQKDNPANYNGWQQQNVTWMNWKNPTELSFHWSNPRIVPASATSPPVSLGRLPAGWRLSRRSAGARTSSRTSRPMPNRSEHWVYQPELSG